MQETCYFGDLISFDTKRLFFAVQTSYVVNFSGRITLHDQMYAGLDKMFEWLFLHTFITLAWTEA